MARPANPKPAPAISPAELRARLERVGELIREISHIAISTTNADGSPHVSPVFFAFDQELNVYWASNPETQHSRNITRGPHVFLALFDSREGHGGFYIQGTAAPITDPQELGRAHTLLNARKAAQGSHLGPISQYGGAPQCIYRAAAERFWLNHSDRDGEGFIVRDRRLEITREQLGPTGGLQP